MTKSPVGVAFFIHDKPAIARAVEHIASNPAKTIDDLHAFLEQHGYEGSRSMAGGWRQGYLRKRRGLLTEDRQHLLVAVLLTTKGEIAEAIKLLPERLATADAMDKVDPSA